MMVNLWTLLDWNSDLFSELVVPSAPVAEYEDQYVEDAPGADSQVFIDNLLMETYELEVCYPDPEIMQKMIGAWSKKNIGRWQSIYNTYWYKYNPIWNKDAVIEEQGTEERDLSGSRETNGDVVNTHSVSGFDSPGTLTDNDKTIMHNDKVKTDLTDSGTIDRGFTRTERGNLGVTMTQDMIIKERELQAYDIYDVMISDFKKQFILSVY